KWKSDRAISGSTPIGSCVSCSGKRALPIARPTDTRRGSRTSSAYPAYGWSPGSEKSDGFPGERNGSEVDHGEENALGARLFWCDLVCVWVGLPELHQGGRPRTSSGGGAHPQLTASQ